MESRSRRPLTRIRYFGDGRYYIYRVGGKNIPEPGKIYIRAFSPIRSFPMHGILPVAIRIVVWRAWLGVRTVRRRQRTQTLGTTLILTQIRTQRVSSIKNLGVRVLPSLFIPHISMAQIVITHREITRPTWLAANIRREDTVPEDRRWKGIFSKSERDCASTSSDSYVTGRPLGAAFEIRYRILK